ncbi:hypothetical protein Ctob_005435 [Chrysochromulina tobinii]|uniref:Uncharacterized protein n=1 Tax=Chrysochromulina tobinii TaxID=1460289 RepID=A0A0M0JDQ7_9EUKA|nr:hypothetical protein Ctob_005435 [Chrysochromulina tobinii]|eukprot:KOO24711.1 hypothetical protein Ctob_005435 [Chrysochromulina sp. CCMP291]
MPSSLIAPLALLAALVDGAPTPCPKGVGGAAGWLCVSTFSIPGPIDIGPLDVGGGYQAFVDVKGLKCGGLQIGKLGSAVTLGVRPELAIGLDNLILNCSATHVNLKLEHHGFPSLPTVSIDASLAVDLGLTLEFSLALTDAGGLPAAAAIQVSKVDLPKLVIDLEFEGALRYLKGAIDAALESVIKAKVPAALKQALEGLGSTLTSALEKLDHMINDNFPWPTPLPEPALPPPPTKLVSWPDSAALGAIDYVLNDVVGASGPLGIAGLVKLATGGGNLTRSNLTFASGDRPIALGNLSLVNISIAALSATLEGLDHVRELSLLEPDARTAHALDVALAWQDVRLRLRLRLHVAPVPGGLLSNDDDLDEVVEVVLRLSEMALRVELLLGVNQTFIETLQQPSALDGRCMLHYALMLPATHGLTPQTGVPSMALNVSIGDINFHDFTGFPLEAQVDRLLDNAMALIFSGFPTLVPRLSDSIVGGPNSTLRRAAEGLVDKLGPEGLDGVIDWLLDKLPNSGNGTLRVNVSRLLGLELPLELELELDGLDTISALKPLEVPPAEGSPVIAAAAAAAVEADDIFGRSFAIGAVAAQAAGLVYGPGPTLGPRESWDSSWDWTTAQLSSTPEGGAFTPGLAELLEVAGMPPVSPNDDPAALVSYVAADLLAMRLGVRLRPSAPGAPPIAFNLSVSASNVSFLALWRLELNRSGFVHMPLLSWGEPDCLLHQIKRIEISSLSLDSRQLNLSVWGNEWGAAEPDGITAEVAPKAAAVVPQSLLRAIETRVNVAASSWLDHVPKCPYAPEPPLRPSKPPHYRPWNESRLLGWLNTTLSHITDADLNQAVDRALRKWASLRWQPSAKIHPWIEGPFPNGTIPFSAISLRFSNEIIGDVAVSLSNIMFSGLDQLYGLKVLAVGEEPEHPEALTSGLGLGEHGSLGVSAKLHLRLAGVWTGFDLEIEIRQLLIGLGMLVYVDLSAYEMLSLSSLTTRGSRCFLLPLNATLLDPDSTGFSFDVRGDGFLELGIVAFLGIVGCVLLIVATCWCFTLFFESPEMEELRVTVEEGQANDASPKAARRAAAHTRTVSDGSSALSNESMLAPSSGSETLGGGSEGSTPPRTSTPPGSDLQPLPACPDSLRAAPVDEPDEPIRAKKGQPLGSYLFGRPAPSLDDCLAQHACGVARVSFTLVLLLNGGMFLWGNVQVGAAVHVVLTIAGQPVPMPTIFDFTLFNSVSDFWKSKAYWLAIIIVICSGIWTYLKLILMMFLWWVPPRRFSPRSRGAVLRVLDATGKWCLVDSAMLILLMIAMHFTIVISGKHDAPALVVASVETTPEIGFGLFALATLLSLTMTHVQMYYHRLALHFTEDRSWAASSRTAALENAPTTLGTGSFGSDHLGEARVPILGGVPTPRRLGGSSRAPSLERICVSRLSYEASGPWLIWKRTGPALPFSLWVRFGVPLGLLACEFLTCVAVGMTNFTLHVVGLIGALLGKDANTDFSLVQLASKVGTVSSETAPLALWGLTGFYAILCLVLPLLWIVLALIIWLVPMRPDTLRSMLVFAETVYAWASLDVMLVVIAISLLEIDQVAKFILGSECDSLNEMLEHYDSIGSLLPGEASCFGVQTTLNDGFWVCVLAVVASHMCGGFVMTAAHQALDELDERAGVPRAKAVH